MLPSQTFGRYSLIEQLGRGGMATVFRARDPEFDRDVALKVLPEELLQDQEFRARFQREARSVARLEHPAIVPVYDIGEERGQPYLVMRFMPGGSLGRRLADGSFPVADCVAVTRRIASALDEAHRRGMVHRDIKPGNILFDSYNEAYLSDFGIVKWSQAATTLTGAGMIGTPAYMSPEQSEGRADVGPSADIYALGVVVFQMLTGRLPFESETPIGLALKHIQEPVPQLSSFDRTATAGLQAVIDRAMAKRPKDRYATAGALAQALEKAVSTSGWAVMDVGATVVEKDEQDVGRVRPAPPQPVLPTLRAARRSARPIWIALGLTGAGITVAALFGLAGGGGLVPIWARPLPSRTASQTLATPTVTPLPSSSPTPFPSATALPAGIGPENVDETALLWSSQVAMQNVRFYVAWSPAGDTIAVTSPGQRAIELWDANLALSTAVLEAPPGIRDLREPTWSPDGSRLAALVRAADDHYVIDIWDLPESQIVLTIPIPGNTWCHPRWSPDGVYVSCGASLYDARSGAVQWTAPGTLSLGAFSPDGSLVALGGLRGDTRLYEVATGLPGITLPPHQVNVTGLSWSVGGTLASGAYDGEIFSWPDPSRSGGGSPPPFTASAGGIFELSWSPSGLVLLSAHLDYEARLWDASLQLLRAFAHDGAVISASWSPDGRRFATSAQDGLLRVWGLPDT